MLSSNAPGINSVYGFRVLWVSDTDVSCLVEYLWRKFCSLAIENMLVRNALLVWVQTWPPVFLSFFRLKRMKILFVKNV